MSERDTFGPRLRRERERRGITLETIVRFVETGVKGLGIGNAISSLVNEKAMTETLRAMLVKVADVAKTGAVAGI